jgi:membrane-bound lytic murein transglycosylase D
MNFKVKSPMGYVLGFIGLGAIVVIFIFGFTTEVANESAVLGTNKVSGICLPETLEFAGEKVPLGFFDIKESLEREMLINTYWQSQTLMLIKRTTRYFGIIEPILKKNNVPDDFKYLALAESGFLNVVSPAGAVGFWQFVPGTAKDFGLEVSAEVDERYDLEKSTNAACKFLTESFNVYKSWTMAAAAYNMGRKNLNKQIERQYTTNYYDILLNDETARYVFRILALKLIVSKPEKYGFALAKNDYYPPIPYEPVVVSGAIPDLAKFAFEKKTNYKMLKSLNPWLRDNLLTNKDGKRYVIKVPKEGFREYSKLIDKEEIDRIITQSEQVAE